MFNQYKKLIFITTLLCLSPILASALLWSQLPETIITHWGINNEPNGWMPKPVALIGLPALMAVMNLVCAFAVKIDPKKQNISDKTFLVVLLIMPCLSIVLSAVTISASMGNEVNVGGVVVSIIGVVFIALGNTIPKNATNYTVGTRTPWTLENEDNWQKTNRFAGIGMVIGGILCLIAGAFNLIGVFDSRILVVAVIFAIILLLASLVYSYMLYRKEQA